MEQLERCDRVWIEKLLPEVAVELFIHPRQDFAERYLFGPGEGDR